MRFFVAAVVVASSSVCASSTGQVQYRGRVVIKQACVCQGAHPISALPLVAFLPQPANVNKCTATTCMAGPSGGAGSGGGGGVCAGVV